MIYSKHIIKTLSNTIFLGMFLCLSFNIVKSYQPTEDLVIQSISGENFTPGPEDQTNDHGSR